MKFELSRRTVLRGLGTSMALPLLEGMMPRVSFASVSGNQKTPVRMAFLFAPNGKHMPDWTPESEGPLDKLPPTLESLQDLKSEIFIPGKLALTTAGAAGCGGHSCTVGQFLTGTLPRRTLGNELRNGISIDQLAARKTGDVTRFPSLELGCVPSKYSGDCDSGYSCVYTTHISWRTETAPLPKEVNPRTVFDRLFSNRISSDVGKSRAIRDRERKSILDFVTVDAEALNRRLGSTDQRKLDEYLYSIREIERRVESSEKQSASAMSVNYPGPADFPEDSDEHLRLMLDMLVLAFQTDSTRIASLMIGNGSDNRSFPQLGISEGHHTLSHHLGDQKKHAKLSRINRHYVTQLGYFLRKLRSIREGEGTLLDNSMIVYGCAFGDGNAHDYKDLPILVAGRGGGTIGTGRHVKYEENTPLTNLYLTMLDGVGVGASVERFGDSTGRLQKVGG